MGIQFKCFDIHNVYGNVVKEFCRKERYGPVKDADMPAREVPRLS